MTCVPRGRGWRAEQALGAVDASEAKGGLKGKGKGKKFSTTGAKLNASVSLNELRKEELADAFDVQVCVRASGVGGAWGPLGCPSPSCRGLGPSERGVAEAVLRCAALSASSLFCTFHPAATLTCLTHLLRYTSFLVFPLCPPLCAGGQAHGGRRRRVGGPPVQQRRAGRARRLGPALAAPQLQRCAHAALRLHGRAPAHGRGAGEIRLAPCFPFLSFPFLSFPFLSFPFLCTLFHPMPPHAVATACARGCTPPGAKLLSPRRRPPCAVTPRAPSRRTPCGA